MLANQELVTLAKSEESQYLERKARLPKDGEVKATLCGFANSTPEGQYSVLFIGIEDSGAVGGLPAEELEDSQKKITRFAREGCYPPVNAVPQVVEIEGKQVLAVIVEHSKETPHFTGHAYVRVGPETKKASKEQFEELVLIRSSKIKVLLQEKVRGRVIRVNWNLPEARPELAEKYRAYNHPAYRITDCDAFVLRLENTGSGQRIAVVLDRVTISYSVEHSSMLLLIDQVYPVSRLYDRHG